MRRFPLFLAFTPLCLLFNLSPSYGASILFTPKGEQLDGDGINDIVPGNSIDFNISLNTQGIQGNILFLYYRVSYDIEELTFKSANKSNSTPFENSIIKNPKSGQFDIQLSDSTGASPGRVNVPLNTISFDVKLLKNDGIDDFTISLIGAENDDKMVVVGNFNPRDQTVEVQRVPEPLTIVGSAMALGFGGLFKKEYFRKQKKSKTLEKQKA